MSLAFRGKQLVRFDWKEVTPRSVRGTPGLTKDSFQGQIIVFFPPSHSQGSALTDDAGWIALFILLFPHGGAGTEAVVVWESSSITAFHQSQDVNQKQCRNTPRRPHTHIHTQSNYRTCSSLLTHCRDLVSSFTANFFSIWVQKSKDSHFWTICDRINSSGPDKTRRSVPCRALLLIIILTFLTKETTFQPTVHCQETVWWPVLRVKYWKH